ncbi:hypothetical protein [Saliphagus sp. LR7]|uniref:hypothetical protein n=1 Tax=Saliphagus sp. LR7 TaxID=2282654 RepID=UPI000DF72CEC|nr:hypothetical protein [Saliphagus sp. LR7]
MTETEAETIEFSGDGDHREDLSPGGETASDLFGDVDDAIDYEGAAETWIGEPATTELTIETVGGYQAKRFVLAEPDDEETMEQLLVAVLRDDKREFCEAMVDEPTLTDEIWNDRLTERERQLVFDLAFAWGRFGDFESMAQAADEVEQRLSNMA